MLFTTNNLRFAALHRIYWCVKSFIPCEAIEYYKLIFTETCASAIFLINILREGAGVWIYMCYTPTKFFVYFNTPTVHLFFLILYYD